MYPNLLERFIRYCRINTRSDAKSTSVPTTQVQVDFLMLLKKDLEDMGLDDIFYNEKNGFLTATYKGNVPHAKTIGFIAHVDTADFNSENVQPRIHEHYTGSDIVLDEEGQYILSVEEFPNLKNYIGETLITTSGDTLLGADDKAGIVEILSAIEFLQKNPHIQHGDVRIAFGPDEEIGRGADLFDVEQFHADFAYTMDSGTVGRMEYETFNAAQATIRIKGTSVHPGTAKDRMVNAMKVAMEIDGKLPQKEVPEKTSGYEGFYLLHNMTGTIDEAEMVYIIRDHDKELFEQRKQNIIDIVKEVNASYDQERVFIEVFDQYYNMKDIIEKDMSIVELAKQAMLDLGIEPIIEPFRGGTDGSKISYLGLPTPNLFVGGENFHGRYEFITLESMEKATSLIVKILNLNTQITE
ncbi:peptidase T [Granulicatella sp. zg-ZJ]|uniref:peptidase T n=1 Tax=unclassified Granulicatella TaxID=2630493 RepID=UPI0013BF42E2|nr:MULTISPECIES: peptidase T [unclassified Granulicatella]NEW62084.1 peptidase T [Granulicatella sp. zg-ZJ]NEW66407.1 peptidase T [Granulicatella sp. zg-84]QMI86125.1 peptidase T [Carnobacteriaceae bacterium zg-84]